VGQLRSVARMSDMCIQTRSGAFSLQFIPESLVKSQRKESINVNIVNTCMHIL